MNAPGFVEGAGVALAAALAAGLGQPALAWLLPPGLAWLVLLTGLSGAYLGYLLVRTRARVGRLVTLVLWFLVAGLLGMRNPPFLVSVLIHLGLLSLLRSLYFHARPLSALLDLLLTGVSAVAALGTYLHTGSLFLALWCLFLVQALFVFLPAGAGMEEAASEDEAFDRAHRNAEAALRRLAANRPS